MSATVWPPISHEKLIAEEEETLRAELKWLLNLLQENLGSLKSGLQECVALLAPVEPGTTLAISSLRSESVKGLVTRVGTRMVKGDIRLTLSTLPPPPANPPTPFYPLRLTSDTTLALPQLSHLSTLLNNSLDIIDISTWTGDPQNASFIAGQLKLLSDTISEASAVLKGSSPSSSPPPPPSNDNNNNSNPTPDWTDPSSLLDPQAFTPPLPPTLSPHLTIQDGALVLTIRTLSPLDPTSTPPPTTTTTTSPSPTLTSTLSQASTSLRARLLGTLTGGGSPRRQPHDEEGLTFRYRGVDVVVREKVRVESQDPGLLAVGAKLGAVGREVEGWRGRVGVVRGEEEGDG